MIASPGDVLEEREVIREVIHDWNDVNALDSRIMLSAVGWDTHSSPELGTRPQELINSRLLKDCDLLVGVFWTRLGTPTGKSPSGTVEEIEEHVAAGKPAMIYFSSRPVAPESIDSEQYAQVKSIREKWKGEGLIETYENVDEFRKKFSKQLPVCLAKNDYLKSLIRTGTDTPIRRTLPSQKKRDEQPQLTEPAKKLLQAAAKNNDGTIMVLAHLGGRTIQAGGESFGGDRGREYAKWEAVLKELELLGLVVARGHKGQAYELTHQGWAMADAL
jgi:hypothetical protein